MRIHADDMKDLAARIFAAAGCRQEEARCVAEHLVEANLAGHDSHGVIRISTYVQWIHEGLVIPNQTPEVVLENDSIAVLDGRSGMGQSVGEMAVRTGVSKATSQGVSVVALRDSGHLGRIGDWPLMAAREGLLSLHFVNTSGKGLLVAPFGGISRRLSANPIAAGVPIAGGEPIVLDISGCTIAEGKIRVAFNQGVPVPDGCIIDSEGKPTNDPNVFYGDPPGAILPFGGHKGYGLSIIAEMLAGALTGGGCTNPKNAERLHNGMLSIYLDPKFFREHDQFQREVDRFVQFVKSSQPMTPGGKILMPGEVELQNREQRLRDGLEIDDKTWSQIQETAATLNVAT